MEQKIFSILFKNGIRPKTATKTATNSTITKKVHFYGPAK
jgi:hypothetical protein